MFAVTDRRRPRIRPALDALAAKLPPELCCLVGYPEFSASEERPQLYNSAAVVAVAIAVAREVYDEILQCLTMDPGTVNTKMLLAGWGACGIPVSKANNTYKLATSEEYAWGRVENGSYHFGWGASRDANNSKKLNDFWSKYPVHMSKSVK